MLLAPGDHRNSSTSILAEVLQSHRWRETVLCRSLGWGLRRLWSRGLESFHRNAGLTVQRHGAYPCGPSISRHPSRVASLTATMQYHPQITSYQMHHAIPLYCCTACRANWEVRSQDLQDTEQSRPLCTWIGIRIIAYQTRPPGHLMIGYPSEKRRSKSGISQGCIATSEAWGRDEENPLSPIWSQPARIPARSHGWWRCNLLQPTAPARVILNFWWAYDCIVSNEKVSCEPPWRGGRDTEGVAVDINSAWAQYHHPYWKVTRQMCMMITTPVDCSTSLALCSSYSHLEPRWYPAKGYHCNLQGCMRPGQRPGTYVAKAPFSWPKLVARSSSLPSPIRHSVLLSFVTPRHRTVYPCASVARYDMSDTIEKKAGDDPSVNVPSGGVLSEKGPYVWAPRKGPGLRMPLPEEEYDILTGK